MRITIQIDTESGTVDLQKGDDAGSDRPAAEETGASSGTRPTSVEGARDAGRGPSKPPEAGAPPATTTQQTGAEGPSGAGQATSAGPSAALGKQGQGATEGGD